MARQFGSEVAAANLGWVEPRRTSHRVDRQKLLEKFQQQLHQVEQRISERNKRRVIPYNLMKPSMIINSISI
jgi:hypothetical protein